MTSSLHLETYFFFDNEKDVPTVLRGQVSHWGFAQDFKAEIDIISETRISPATVLNQKASFMWRFPTVGGWNGLRGIVSQIKNLPKGSKIGYDLTETLNHSSRVAVLPIGYWHGLPRLLSSIGKVLINGKKVKILGRISMDMVSVDVTDIRNVKEGDDVIIIGKSGKLEVSVDEIAYLADTINYEIVTRLNPFIKRIIV